MGSLNRKAIARCIPHRWLFLLLDQFMVSDDGKTAIGSYYVRRWHPIWLICHFWGNPVFPGVFLLEAMAQVAGVWHAVETQKPAFGLYRSVSDAKFKGLIRPGNTIQIRVVLVQYRRGLAEYHGEAFVGSERVCYANFSLASSDSKTSERTMETAHEPSSAVS